MEAKVWAVVTIEFLPQVLPPDSPLVRVSIGLWTRMRKVCKIA